jgi:hypothetical protein
MSRENTVLTPDDLNKITQAANGILANLTVIENVAKGHTSDYSTASMTMDKATMAADPELTEKKPPIRCSSCGVVVKRSNPLAGSINPPFPLPGFRNASKFEGKYHYVYCGITCNEKLSAAISARTSDVDQHPYQTGAITH